MFQLRVQAWSVSESGPVSAFCAQSIYFYLLAQVSSGLVAALCSKTDIGVLFNTRSKSRIERKQKAVGSIQTSVNSE